MPTEEIAYQITIRGGEEAARVIEAIERAMNKQTAELQRSNAALNQNAGASKNANNESGRAAVGFNTFGSTLGLVGQQVGRLNPQLGQIASTAGQATGVIQTMTTAGLGPFGVAVGAATVAIPLLTSAIEYFGNSAERESVRLARGLNSTVEDLIRNMRDAREQQALFERIANGTASRDEAQANYTVQVQQFTQASNRLSSMLGDVDVDGVTNLVGERLRTRLREIVRQNIDGEAEEARAALHQMDVVDRRQGYVQFASNQRDRVNERQTDVEAAAEANDAWNELDAKRRNARDSARRGGGGGGRSAAQLLEDQANERLRAELALQAKLREIQDQSYAAELERQNKINAADRLAGEEAIAQAEAVAAVRQKLADEEAARADSLLAKQLQNAEELARRQAEASQVTRDAWKLTWDSGKASLDAFGGAAGDALRQALEGGGDMAAGFKNFIDEKLKALAIDETVAGLGSLAVAVGNTIFNPPLAASKYAEAGLHFAAAGVAGGISAAIPDAKSGGAGVGGGETRPQRSSGSSGRDAGPTVINLHVGGDVVTAGTKHELGRMWGDMIRAADARLRRS